MNDFLEQFLKELEHDPMVKKTTHKMFRDKHPRITFNVGGNIEQVTVLSNATYEDFMAALGLDKEEDSND